MLACPVFLLSGPWTLYYATLHASSFLRDGSTSRTNMVRRRWKHAYPGQKAAASQLRCAECGHRPDIARIAPCVVSSQRVVLIAIPTRMATLHRSSPFCMHSVCRRKLACQVATRVATHGATRLQVASYPPSRAMPRAVLRLTMGPASSQTRRTADLLVVDAFQPLVWALSIMAYAYTGYELMYQTEL